MRFLLEDSCYKRNMSIEGRQKTSPREYIKYAAAEVVRPMCEKMKVGDLVLRGKIRGVSKGIESIQDSIFREGAAMTYKSHNSLVPNY